MSYIGLQEKYNRIRILIQMARKDGFFNLAELTYIVWVSQKLGLSKADLDEISSEKGSYSAPFSENERLDLLFELVKIMYVDGEVVESELDHFNELADKMSLNTSKTESLITLIKASPNKLMERAEFDAVYA